MTYCWRAWHRGLYIHFVPWWSCYCVLVLWLVMVVIQPAIWWYLQVDVDPSPKCMWSCWSFCQWRCPCPQHIAWKLHPSSVDAPADVHGRSHSLPFIHPREAFLTWCWVFIRPSSSCGIVLLSLPSGVGLTGVGLVYPSHVWQMPTHQGILVSDTMRSSQLWHRTH